MSDVVTLCWGKKLKEAGYPQDESEKGYIVRRNYPTKLWSKEIVDDHITGGYPGKTYAAPFAGELIEKLPYHIIVDDVEYQLEIIKLETSYVVQYLTLDRDKVELPIIRYAVHKQLSDACAILWIWLKKEGKD